MGITAKRVGQQLLALLGHPRFLLGVILLGATALRIWHLDRWLPEIYEEATPVLKARDFWGWQTGSFDFNPHFFNYPALSFYIHFVGQALVFFLGYLGGYIGSLAEFRQWLGTDLDDFVLLGRAITTLLDLAGITAIYALGQRLGGPRVALLAALVVAINSLHIRNSQYVIVDIPLFLFCTLALSAICAAAATGRWADYLRAGLYIGLATSTKYTAALLVVALGWAGLVQAFDRPGLPWRRIGLSVAGAAMSLAVFLVLNPYVLLSFDIFWAHFSFEREHMARGHFGHDLQTNTAWFYLYSLWQATSIGMVAFGWAFYRNLRQRKWDNSSVFVWIGLYLLVVGSWNMRGGHYLLPVVAPLLVVALSLLEQIRTQLANPRWQLGIVAAFIGVYSLGQIPVLAQHYQAVSTPDTRQQAKDWFEANIPPNALVAAEHYTYYPAAQGPLFLMVRLPLDSVDPHSLAPFYQLGWYENFDYIVISSEVYRRYQQRPETFPRYMEFYRALARDWRLEKRFVPGLSVGPEIIVYTNPRTQRPDGPFAVALYQSLENMNVDVVIQFLNGLGYALEQAGYMGRAVDIAEKMKRAAGQKK